jgi:hypothetical protein
MPRRKRSVPAFSVHDTVRSAPELLKGQMYVVPRKHIAQRKPDTPGYVAAQVGEVFLVQHAGDPVTAVYDGKELIYAHDGYWAVEHPIEGISYRKEFRTHTDAEDYCETLRDDGVEPTMEGPFFSDKELEEGPQKTRSLFDHLIDE